MRLRGVQVEADDVGPSVHPATSTHRRSARGVEVKPSGMASYRVSVVLSGESPRVCSVTVGREDRQGTTLGRFRLLRLVGRGGMGQVYEAVDTVKRRTVAVKLLSDDLSHDEVFRARFLRESRAVAGLNGPHVIPIHDFGEIDGELYLEMRYVDGTDLRGHLRRGSVDPAFAVDIVTQVARALDAAHGVGLVHRDVKPENILIDSTGFAYLADFGLARSTEDTSLTATGVPVGSFNYMAPERFSEGEDSGLLTDVYALTCVLYECISGEKPFGSGSLEQVIAGHLHGELPTTGTAFDPVIAAGSAKEPAARYDSAGALARDAQRALTGRATAGPLQPTHDQSVVETLVPPAARLADRHAGNRLVLSIGAILLVALLAASGYSVYHWSNRDSARVATPPDRAEAAATTAWMPDTSPAATITDRRTSGDDTPWTLKDGLDVAGASITTVPCDGTGAIHILWNSTSGDPALYSKELAENINANPGANYMRADQFIVDDGARLGECASIRPRENGRPIYIVYTHHPSVQAACAADDPRDDHYVRRLDQSTESGFNPCT